jgi:diguanylate cyclase (GGDEF)-like protein
MNIPDTIFALLEDNEKIAKKFYHIETSVLTVLNFRDFFELLLTEISQTFVIPHVWISIIQETEIAEQILAMQDSAILQSSTGFLTQENFMSLIGPCREPLLVNKNLERFNRLLPPASNYGLGSITLLPVFLGETTVGSLNLADTSKERFKPGMDTDLLSRLALKISLCLSNVAAHERLKQLAFCDPLTGLLNRRMMESVLEGEFERSKRYGTQLSVAFLDLDDFKQINDTFGHEQGDKTLIFFARSLDTIKRTNDIIARFGGDEFIIILPSTPGNEAVKYIRRLEALMVEKPMKIDQKNHENQVVQKIQGFQEIQEVQEIKFSWGIASIRDPEVKTCPDLLNLADQRLYLCKNAKKKINSYEVDR